MEGLTIRLVKHQEENCVISHEKRMVSPYKIGKLKQILPTLQELFQ